MALSRLPSGGAHWVDHVTRHAFAVPDRVAIRFAGESVTWRQLDARVRALAAALHERGVVKGDRVAVLMTNRPEFAEAVIAANAVGAIAVPVNFRFAPDEAAYVLRDSGAALVVTDVPLAPLAAAATGALDQPVPVLVAGLDPAGAGPAGAAGAGPGSAGPGSAEFLRGCDRECLRAGP
jgi:fatty-acyl-CoA synthase